MFASAGYTAFEQSPGRLLVTAPGRSLFGTWFIVAMPLLCLSCAFLIQRTLKREYAKAVIRYPQLTIKPVDHDVRQMYRIFGLIAVGGTVFFWAVGYTSGSIELDRDRNTATLTARMTAFLPAGHKTVPLDSIQDAILDEHRNSRRIRLESTSGPDLAFPIWTDRPGQEDAVRAINRFLNAGARPGPR